MSEPIPRRHRVVAIGAIVLGVLGVSQAVWIAWSLFSSGSFELLDSAISASGPEDWVGWVQLVHVALGIIVHAAAVLLGLVTSAAAIVGGGVALAGRLYFLRWTALASLLHIVIVEILCAGVLLALSIAQVSGLPGPMDPTGLAASWLADYVGPIGLAILRSAFWTYALSVARAQPVLASDLRPGD